MAKLIKKDNIYIFYYFPKNPSRTTGEKYLSLKNSLDNIAYLSFFVCRDDVNISYLYVPPTCRGCGVAKNLLKSLIDFSKDKTIYLDDMSDRYRMNNNIYLEAGFKYCDDYCGPEMVYY